MIGITSGCFDIIHPLHIQYLTKCRRECDFLIVLLDSDKLVSLNKNHPIFNENDRKFILESLDMVNQVIIFNNLEEFKEIIIDITNDNNVKMFKNSGNIYGQPTIQIPNTELVIIQDVERFSSSTQIKNFIKQQKI